MSSEPPQEPAAPAPVVQVQQQMYGRTGWDAAFAGRRFIISAVAAICLVVLYVWLGPGPFEDVWQWCSDNWPVLAAPFAGWACGYLAVKSLYNANVRIMLMTDLGESTVRLVAVPEARYRTMRQAGNMFVLHSMGGTPVYIVNSIDEGSGCIDYGWIHEERAEVVAARLSAYQRWHETLTRTVIENLQLMADPEIIAAGLSKKNLRRHLDGICAALGFKLPEDSLDGAPETEAQDVRSEEKAMEEHGSS